MAYFTPSAGKAQCTRRRLPGLNHEEHLPLFSILAFDFGGGLAVDFIRMEQLVCHICVAEAENEGAKCRVPDKAEAMNLDPRFVCSSVRRNIDNAERRQIFEQHHLD
ncbi:MAG: hypothetical protein J7639_28335 [Paenibacillaceae bacterium]|nr:hypothetical protein [Paenibacillaceae bacterium]